jgi:hypothetical protein
MTTALWRIWSDGGHQVPPGGLVSIYLEIFKEKLILIELDRQVLPVGLGFEKLF